MRKVDAAASVAGEGVVPGVTAHVQSLQHGRLQEPVRPGGVVVRVAGAACNVLNAVVVVIRRVPAEKRVRAGELGSICREEISCFNMEHAAIHHSLSSAAPHVLIVLLTYRPRSRTRTR